jgi:nucleoside-diphosphate-sugar epimerase
MADSGAQGSVGDSSRDRQRGVRHALVTGGIGDIGAAVGRRLAADGFHVTLLDRSTVPVEGGASLFAFD